MNKRLILVLGVLVLLVSACGPVIRGSGHSVEESREVSGFDRVSLSGLGELIITQGAEESLTIEAEDNLVRYIETEVRSGTLHIDFPDEPRRVNVIPTDPVRFYLTVKQLSGLSMSGAGRIGASSLKVDDVQISISGAGDVDLGSLTAKELDIRVSGAGDIDIDALEADELTLRLSGAGDVDIAGQVKAQQASLSGLGSYGAGDLESQTAKITISGAGGAKVHVTEELDVRISGAGSVKYYGNPTVSKDISGLGKVSALGER